MHKLAGIAFLALLLAVSAGAQGAPKAEVFGGYSYSRVEGSSGISGINLNGWNASVTGNVNSWFGVTADFSGHYGSPNATSLSRHSFLFGPKLTYRGNDKVNPFVHALVGVVRAHRGISPPGPIIPQVPPASESALGISIGGGVDYKVNERFAIRLVQADYLLTRFKESSGIVCIQSITTPCPATQAGTQNNVRLSFGVVWRFGSR